MELWIRSQDRCQLAKITSLLLLDKEIRGFNNTKYFYELGTYKTKERALEVLDKIQNRLMPYSDTILNAEGITISYKDVSTIIYEMPKE